MLRRLTLASAAAASSSAAATRTIAFSRSTLAPSSAAFSTSCSIASGAGYTRGTSSGRGGGGGGGGPRSGGVSGPGARSPQHRTGGSGGGYAPRGDGRQRQGQGQGYGGAQRGDRFQQRQGGGSRSGGGGGGGGGAAADSSGFKFNTSADLPSRQGVQGGRRDGAQRGGSAGAGPVVPRSRDWTRRDSPDGARSGRATASADDASHAQATTRGPRFGEDEAISSVGAGGPMTDKGDRDDRGGRGDRASRKKSERGSFLDADPTDERSPGGKAKDKSGKDIKAKGKPNATVGGSSKPKAKTTPAAAAPPRQVFLPSVVTVSNLARQMGVRMRTLQNAMTESGMTDTRPDLILPFAEAEMLAAEFNMTAVVNEEAAFDILPRDPAPADVYATLPLRAPVVTIMGHVDHGKTTLLDKLRSTAVAAGEAGGITQHIGAFSVPVRGASSSSSSPSSSDSVQTITFLDTPGHAAFTAMRSRGAAVTDIVVLVVAADDGVMPQTREVIDLVRSLSSEGGGGGGGGAAGTTSGNLTARRRQQGGVQMVVALTKVDKSDSDAERVKRDLLSAGVELEELGGDVPCVEVSGKTGQGLEELEETLAALAEMADLRAERDGRPDGYVIESKVEKARGNVATVLVKRGCFKAGDLLLAGTAWCKVRAILDSQGKAQKVAYPGDPVLVTGWRELAIAGEEVVGAPDESSIKRAVENRKRRLERLLLIRDVEMINEQRKARRDELDAQAKREYEERKRRREERMAASQGIEGVLAEGEASGAGDQGEVGSTTTTAADGEAADEANPDDDAATSKRDGYKTLNLIIKADFTGTVEAVVGAISSIGTSEAGVKIISSGVGPPTETDVAKASALGGHVVCFNVDVPKSVAAVAARSHPPVVLQSDSVIYRLMEHVSTQVASLLPPVLEQRVTGEATIAALFNFSLSSKVSRTVAGCRVMNGVVSRSNLVRILRSDEEGERREVWKGRLDQLKQGKKDVAEMRKGTECGLSFVGFEGFKEGDVVQSYYEVEVPRKL